MKGPTHVGGLLGGKAILDGSIDPDDCVYCAIVQGCPYCPRWMAAVVASADIEKYLGGELVQVVWSEKGSSFREWIINGLCPACQAAFWVDEE